MNNTDRRQRSFVDPEVLAQLSALPLLSRKPMLGNLSGRHTSPHRGSSVEFAEYRKYVPGDDLRRLDWRAYGRSDRFYIKEFEADTNLRMVLVIDTSGSMGVDCPGGSKLDYARRLAAALGYLAILQGDAVGLACVAEGILQHLPARRSPGHLSTLFDQLEEARPDGVTGLPGVLHELAETVRQRALIVVFSDFFFDPGQLRDGLEHLRFRKHDVSLFHLLSPEELQFDFQRPTRFIDTEGGTAIFADPVEIADRYREAISNYLENLRRVCLETAVDYRRVLLDRSYDQTLRDFLMDRAYRGRSR
jgi:uncharacterized protein (DUF58 family)